MEQALVFTHGIKTAYRRCIALIVRHANQERMAIYPRMLIGLVLILSIFNWSQGQPLRDGFGNKLGLDFIAFYIAGRSVLEDSGQNLYDLEWQRSTQQKVLNYDQTSFTPFINPPYATAIYALFSHDSYRLSYGLWVLTSFLLLLLSCTLLARNLLNRSRQSAFRFIYFSLAFFPTYLWFFYGQATGFLLLILSAAFVLLRQGKDFRAGFVLGLLAFKPQIALCLLLPIIIKRRYRAMAGGLFALSLWAIIAYCFFYQQMIEFWAFKAVLPAILVNEGYPTWGITSLYGFSQLLIGGFSINAANILCLFLSAIALFVIFGHWKNEPWKPASMQWDLSMAGTFAFSLLAGVHLFSYDLTLLLRPITLSPGLHSKRISLSTTWLVLHNIIANLT